MSDIFREVDEELRHENYKRLWDKYGLYVVAVAVLIVVGTAGYRGWEAWEASRSREAGDRFVSALEAADQGQATTAEEALNGIAADAPSGYAALAEMRAASLAAETDNIEQAITSFRAIADNSSLAKPLRDAARIRAGYLMVDTASYDDLKTYLAPMAATGEPWRHSAREIIGLAAYKADDVAAAKENFEEIVADRAAPQELRQRAEIMLGLIGSRSGAATADSAPSTESSPAADSAPATDNAAGDESADAASPPTPQQGTDGKDQ
ncbi:tetratricopeptide repeat protein [Rhodobium gokarnense]|uniref:Ancillary SecYEG translocon subunit/Cell division coordinator CpoB TPR domain-containing protein n=1 Tax=Rhodobium gokarnense TaxID=364296 RepID=A0ABT3HFG2_9HYPH|nr:tetratricopeptide repeat protein [Rhodobium gokarnense]MCW2309143.1 hypothetical protein [Rhodobium gokarnense]